MASVGHIRDLPRGAKYAPKSVTKPEVRRLGIDVDDHFTPVYVVPDDKKQVVAKLKAALKDASELYLATDEDREGEAISWHLLEVLKPRVPVKRMVFHEITSEAIQEAIENWRDLDMKLVEAQEGRRILDRLYGYEVSNVAFRRIGPGTSAGRVQSVAHAPRRRPRTRAHGVPQRFLLGPRRQLRDADGYARFPGDADDARRQAPRVGTRLRRRHRSAQSRTPTSRCSTSRARSRSPRASRTGRSRWRRSRPAPTPSDPKAPFITSTLQQEAGRKLGFSAARTMHVAQGLYERGLITYMRTDSTSLSAQAVERGTQPDPLDVRRGVPPRPAP